MERNVGAIENQEKFRLVVVEQFQCLVQGFKACLGGENRIEPDFEFFLLFFAGRLFVSFQVGVEIPDLGADVFERLAVSVMEADQPVHGSLCVDPTQSVLEKVELPRIVAYDDQLFVEAVLKDTAYKRTFGGDTHMPFRGDIQ